jgi:hypothetical protein
MKCIVIEYLQSPGVGTGYKLKNIDTGHIWQHYVYIIEDRFEIDLAAKVLYGP